jgi:hypothetical protein
MYPETLDFLIGALESGQPTIILSHHAVVRIGVDWLDVFLPRGIEKFWEIVEGKNVLGIFSGHLHTSYEQLVNMIPVFGLRATTFQFAPVQEKLFCLMPPHYRIVTVQDQKISTELVAVEL